MPLAGAADASTQFERGQALYAVHCASCHQFSGEGVPGAFPPLAGSDYLMADKERSIRIAVQGQSGEITVNGVVYNGVMPPLPALDDNMIADVTTYVRGAWSNRGDAVTLPEVQAVRAQIAAAEKTRPDPFAPLPAAPPGFTLREVVKLPAHGIRLAGIPGMNWIFVLNNLGDLYRLEPATGNLVRVLAKKEYSDVTEGEIAALGLTIDSQRRLYISTNHRLKTAPYHTNRVIIFRSAPLDDAGAIRDLKPWLRTSYPWGPGPYTHGVGHIAEGPDGLMYVSSGSRTDGGEAGTDPVIWPGGETETTAGIWRLDPREESPQVQMFAYGIRNAWTFAWNDRGELFSASNGPDADLPEELDFVESGKHYGFPFRFADGDVKPYPHTPLAAAAKFTAAIRNFGPAAGGSPEKPIASFHPHSSPAGMLFCGPEWPAALRGKFLLGRYGNFLGDYNVGFDVLAVDLKRNAAGVFEARMDIFLAPVARPMDLLQMGRKLYVLEYTRPTDKTSGRPMNPGRILELSW